MPTTTPRTPAQVSQDLQALAAEAALSSSFPADLSHRLLSLTGELAAGLASFAPAAALSAADVSAAITAALEPLLQQQAQTLERVQSLTQDVRQTAQDLGGLAELVAGLEPGPSNG